jgi:Xaa-Pro aminopeptidase
MIRPKPFAVFLILLTLCLIIGPLGSPGQDTAGVLSMKEQSSVVLNITRLRLDRLLPKIMRETNFDMWIIVCQEDDLDPVFKTMIPYRQWCPITQMLIFFDPGDGRDVERLNLSRTDMQGLHRNAWDFGAWDREKKESQWACLERIVRERDPKRIGINESEVIWAADGLSSSLKKKLAESLGPRYAARLQSAEALSTLWLETLLEEEFALYERAAAISHAFIAEALSNRAVTPGFTTTDDLVHFCHQKAANLGLTLEACTFGIWGRDPREIEKYGKKDNVIRPGDLVHCDLCLMYLMYHADQQQWGYVLRPGEDDAPEGLKRVLAEGNRLQDVFMGELKAGLTGNEILRNILAKAKEAGIGSPKIYSHSVGYYLHEPGPLIGLPWEQSDTGGRGDVKLVPNSLLAMESAVALPIPEWNNSPLRFALEENIFFTPEKAAFFDGRQTKFHLIK